MIAATNLKRDGYGFEIKKEFHYKASKWLEEVKKINKEVEACGYSKTLMVKQTKINGCFLHDMAKEQARQRDKSAILHDQWQQDIGKSNNKWDYKI